MAHCQIQSGIIRCPLKQKYALLRDKYEICNMTIYHNPRCQKSRQTLALLQSEGINPEIVLYLEVPPTVKELAALLKKLKIKPFDLIRKSEKVFKENFKDEHMSDKEWIEVMVEHPKLIERPIVISGRRAVIGRPPEMALELIV